ncbi:hypothetical protein AXF42_Ash007716 [Apostasia shenzhenica]|uniref:Stress-response A/B barrel domain-containing protein n=1 Tax=Apostasia shenzhenica TaxID=1088818 RepID=A0A2I0A687_9ASPA|nr:hypothetical protein AXF42_Ash007716 [Apostasia shenzhenica]
MKSAPIFAHERKRRRRRRREVFFVLDPTLICFSGMPLLSHWAPIAPLGRTLAPDIRPHSEYYRLPLCLFLRSSWKIQEKGVESKGCRNGEKARVFAGTEEYRASKNAPTGGLMKKRKIVEHILLLRAKVEISDVDEKDMLDCLYTSQYQMNGIIAISLGRVQGPNIDNITHVVYMRFKKKGDVARFFADPHYLKVLKDHVMPYCYVCPGMNQYLWIMNLKLRMTCYPYFVEERISTMELSAFC